MKIASVNAWVVFLDVYGFKIILKDTSNFISKTSEKLSTSHNEVSKMIKRRSSPAKLFVFSDCMFLAYLVKDLIDDKKNKFKWCIEDTAEVLNIFSKEELPLRGGIAYGTACASENLLIGEAVLKAVHYEELVPCPAVLLPEKELLLCFGNSPSVLHNLRFTDVTLKLGGITSAALIFPDPIDHFFSLVAKKYKKHIIEGPYQVAQTWKEALDSIHEHYPKQAE